MLWPNGPARVLRQLGDYCQDGKDEALQAIAISRHRFYIAMCTKTQIGLLRVKPLAPTFIYTDNEADFSNLYVSHTGKYIAAQSGQDIHVFEAYPQDNFDEVLQLRSPFNHASLGPGEALGVRELKIRKLGVLTSAHEIVAISPFHEYFVVVSPEHIQFSAWKSLELQLVHAGPLLDGFKVVGASHSSLLSRLCLLCDNHQAFLVHIKRDQFKALPLPEEEGEIHASCFNLRFAKLVVAYADKLIFYSVKDLNEPPQCIELPSIGRICTLEWAPSGLALFIGHSKGWCMVSVLGALLYCGEQVVKQCDWSVAGDELFLLLEDGNLVSYEIMRMYASNPQNINTPILYSGNRIMLYNDTSEHILPYHPWITVPLPTSYLAYSWPIISAAMSQNGKFVAVAGSYGLAYMSTHEKQWKIFAERDIMVRANGILWYNDFLILSLLDEYQKGKVAIYSTCIAKKGIKDEEEQPISTISCDQVIMVMAVDEPAKILSVLLQNGHYLRYGIEGTPKLLNEVDLIHVLHAPGRVRSMTQLNEYTTLFLIDDRLIRVVLSGKDITRRTIHFPVEYYCVEDNKIWAYSESDSMVIISGYFENEMLDKHSVGLEAYPVGINHKKGLISTVETRLRQGYDRSFEYIELCMELQVYLPTFFEHESDIDQLAQKHAHLAYFDDIMESTLYHALIEKKDLEAVLEVIKRYCNWQQVIVHCARKTETKYWQRLFDALGKTPEQLFADSLDAGNLGVAAEYLMVLQAQFKADPGDRNMITLFQQAMNTGNFDICKQLSEFLLAIDGGKGLILKKFAADLGISP